MVNLRSKNDFPSQKEWLADQSLKEKIKYAYGGCSYYLETFDRTKVFTLRAARRYKLEELKIIMDYMIMSDYINILENKKDIISFDNIMTAIKEKAPQPTEEEKLATKKAFERFKRNHPEYFGEIGEEV